MKKNITVFGLIGGFIVTLSLVFATVTMKNNPAGMIGPASMIVGFGLMLLTFSLIFFALKNYRDKYNDGILSYSDGLKIGIGITLIASVIYVISWIIIYKNFIPDFMERYSAIMLSEYRASGKSEAEIAGYARKLEKDVAAYHTWWGVIWRTFVEIFPLGLLVSLIAPLFMMRRQNKHKLPGLASE